MAINQNHLFEELNGVKCGIVEKNVSAARVEFLRGILEFNGFTVVVAGSPPPKAAGGVGAVGAGGGAGVAAVSGAGGSAAGGTTAVGVVAGGVGDGVAAPVAVPVAPAAPAAPASFTVGVTDVMFNPTNAIFGRLLRTADGHVVTLAYWQQKEKEAYDETPYFEGR
jgi:hypothetical protein